MTQPRCPGQDMRYWKPEDIFYLECPWCGEEIEYWRDEPKRLCGGCKRFVRNPRIDLSCAQWCKSAAACVGKRQNHHPSEISLCHQLILAMRKAVDDNPESVAMAATTLEKVEDILEEEEGGSALLIRAAAILHVIGGDGFKEDKILPVLTAIFDELDVREETRNDLFEILHALSHSHGDDEKQELCILREAKSRAVSAANYKDE